MDWVAICTKYYNAGYYDNESLKVFVQKGKITEEDYKNITDIDYITSE